MMGSEMTIRPTPSAPVLIDNRFKITGRGLVLTGKILEDVIHPGDILEFEANSNLRIRKFKGLEIFPKANPAPKAGLLIECINDAEIDELRAWEPCGAEGSPTNGTVALVFRKV
jgi:hypothetical protein